MIRQLICLLGFHESLSYEEWDRVIGQELLKRKLSDSWTLRDWISAVDRTQNIWLRTCKHCGKRN